MPNGRIEIENRYYNKIEKELSQAPQVIKDWYFSLRAEDKSYRTIDSYLSELNKFVSSSPKYKDSNFYNKVRENDINEYLIKNRTMIKNGNVINTSPSARKLMWSGLKSFFTFVYDNKYIENNPINNKNRPKTQAAIRTTYLTAEEVNTIIDNISNNAKPDVKIRDLCMFVMGVTTGLRCSAMIQINIEDIDFETKKVCVVEKQNKTCDIILDDVLFNLIIQWLDERKQINGSNKTDALFINNKGKRISQSMWAKNLQKYTDVVDKHVTPHVLRHTCATLLYAKTGDIYLCASQLNHASVQMTQRYAAIVDDRKKEAANILGSFINI